MINLKAFSGAETLIKPRQKWQLLDLPELWRFRELLLIFTWRDIKVRYKQTFLGVAWVILQPLVTMFVFTVFFGKLAKIPSGNLPYQLFVFIGLVFWTYFSTALTSASNSFVENANIIKKVYFPKEILPISSVITATVDFGINLCVLSILTFYFGFRPSPIILIIAPISIFITILSASGLGFFLASVNVKYRDVRYILPFFIQMLLFLTPVIYGSFSVRDSIRGFLLINPLTGVIESMRVAISGTGTIEYKLLLISFFGASIIFVLGLLYFKSTERFFADIA